MAQSATDQRLIPKEKTHATHHFFGGNHGRSDVAWLGLSHLGTNSTGVFAFAQTVEQIQKAKTFTWKTTFFHHTVSKDGKRTWLESEVHENAFKAPGRYRVTHFDKEGKVRWVEIKDAEHMKALRLNPQKKEAFLSTLAFELQDPRGPFIWIEKELRESNLEWVGKRTNAKGEINIFRHRLYDKGNGRDWSYDFWIDQRTKQLVELHVPGADIYDPNNDPARTTPPEKDESADTSLGFMLHDIVIDADLDASLFRLQAPENYTVKTEVHRAVTEKDMIDYLGIVADYNARTFPDQVFPFIFSSDRTNKICDKPEKERTPAEQKLHDTNKEYIMAGLNLLPVGQFVQDHTAEKTFRYLGKGVKLGDKERIVCWYKLKDAKDANTYRVVYGDLTVKDVAAKDLPLPVEP